MNIYKNLNEITKYIDDNLEEEISYEKLSKILGVNVYTMQRLFSMITDISLAEYIRKRRLSNATSFSRAFERFHGIKPSLVNKHTKLKNFPKIFFNENIKMTTELDYEIITLDKMDLYGVSIATNNSKIGIDAPLFFRNIIDKYSNKYGEIKYGMITYDIERENSKKYYCLFDKKIEKFEHIIIPKSKWLKFRINSQDAKEIQELSHKFYNEFLPSINYNLKELPELEYYHDNVTDFLVAIY